MPVSIMVDCSHANSEKSLPAAAVLDNVLEQIQNGADSIHAVMIESHLNSGNQSFPRQLDELEYGVSILMDVSLGYHRACLRRAADVG